MKVKLTAIVIAKNEEGMIADCLDSLSFCQEVIVIDNSSEDRTSEIATHLKAYVITSQEESFAEKRNLGMRKAKGEWVLYIDADERVPEELAEEIVATIEKKDQEIVAFRIKRRNFYLGNHEWPKIDVLERLFLKAKFKEWYGDLHESALVNGEIGELEHALTHFTHRTLTTMLAKTIVWSEIEARLRLAAHHPLMSWWRFPRVMASTFFEYYIRQRGYRVGIVGIIESMYQMFSTFITYARLWEIQKTQNK